MDGIAVMAELLTADAGVLALVPEERIGSGVLPIGTELDAISITRVSSIDRNIVSPGAERHVTERVQVTALAATYPRQKAILRAVKAAAADFVGEIAGLENVTVHTESAGPDFMDDQASIYLGSQDFFVGFSEPR